MLANNSAVRSYFDTQVNFFTELAHRGFDAAGRLGELNLRLGQQLMEESVSTGRQMLTCSDPVQMGALALKRAEPLARHLRAYQQQLLSLVAGAQAGLTQAAEAYVPEAGRSAAAIADEMSRRPREAGTALAGMQRAASAPGRWNGPDGGQQNPG